MNNIFIKQNTLENQRLVVTQHFIYKRAKIFVFLLFLVSVVIPFAFNIALIWINNILISASFSFISICLVIVCELLKAYIVKLKYNAALVQQKFDTIVFEMNNIFCFKEDVIDYYLEKYKNKNWSRKNNWYPDYGKMNKNEAVFYCQKENVDWTNNLSYKFIVSLIMCIIFMIVVIIINLIFSNGTVVDIVTLFVIAMPLFAYTCSGIVKIINDHSLLTNLKKFFDQIDCLIQNKVKIESSMLENLQWMIFCFRQNQYLIPDWFEVLFHNKLLNSEKIKVKRRNM